MLTTSSALLYNGLVFVAWLLCATAFFYALGALWASRMPRLPAALLCGLFMGAGVPASALLLSEPLGYISLFVLALVLLPIFYKASLLDSAYAATFFVFHLMVLKGVAVGAASLLLNKNMFQVFSVHPWSDWVLVAAAVLQAGFMLLYCKVFGRVKGYAFITCRKELCAVFYAHGGLAVFMLFYSYNYYYNLDLMWFSFAQVLLSLLMLIIFILTLNYGVRVANLLEIDLRSKQLSGQMRTQLAQYSSYQSIGKKVLSFKHAFREFIMTATYLIENKQVDKAKDMLQNQSTPLLDTLPGIKEFSNDAVCNALLFGLYNSCEIASVKMDARLYIPPKTSLTAQQLQYLLTGLVNLSLPLAQRAAKNGLSVIQIENKTQNNWITIMLITSYSGTIEFTEEREPVFLMDDAEDLQAEHRYLSNFLTGINGILHYEADPARRLLSIAISLHYDTLPN